MLPGRRAAYAHDRRAGARDVRAVRAGGERGGDERRRRREVLAVQLGPLQRLVAEAGQRIKAETSSRAKFKQLVQSCAAPFTQQRLECLQPLE